MGKIYIFGGIMPIYYLTLKIKKSYSIFKKILKQQKKIPPKHRRKFF